MADHDLTIATWNINSINLRLEQVLQWLERRQPSVLGLQETKTRDIDFPAEALHKAGWQCEFHGQKSYNGVCLIARDAPQAVARGLGGNGEDDQARCITGEVAGVRIINCYVPQGSEVGSDKHAYKLDWLKRLLAFLEGNFSPAQPLAVIGDINIAPDDIDLYAPEYFENEVGCHPEERQALEAIKRWGLTDCFRHLHPDLRRQYTFFDYRVRDAVKYAKGWRIDHILATRPLLDRLLSCEIDLEPRRLEKASDHAPVIARFRAT